MLQPFFQMRQVAHGEILKCNARRGFAIQDLFSRTMLKPFFHFHMRHTTLDGPSDFVEARNANQTLTYAHSYCSSKFSH